MGHDHKAFLSLFYEAIVNDPRIGPLHISLYVTLYQLWLTNNSQKALRVKRREVMEFSKISSSATYHKYLRELVEYGFITYYPSSDPGKGSEVYFRAGDERDKDACSVSVHGRK